MQILYVLLAVLAFGILIFVHELGHFIAARACHVKIFEFSIGMGPKLVWYESKKTGITYSLRMFPIGGYVSMAGEDDESDDPNALPKKPAWQRLIITAAGALMNLLLGFLLVFCYVLYTPAGGTTIGELSAEYEEKVSGYAQEDRLQLGDEIVSVDGTAVHIASDLFFEISRKGIEPIDLEIVRNGKKMTVRDVDFKVYTEQGEEFAEPFFRVMEVRKTPSTVLKQTVFSSYNLIRMVFTTVFDLITGRYSLGVVSGPVGAASAMSEVAAVSLMSFLYLVAAVAINIGLFNLFPIPALDGFRILFILIEMIRRKPIPEKYERTINGIGITVLFGLMILICFKDILQIF
ncbi:MAG: site-2 protease family protein [Clostridia bacterium]|nr:site-2 protease family protein [Clostridia bacterium]